MNTSVLAGALACLTAWGSVAAQAAVPGAADQSADGAALFAENCATCHNGSVPRAPHIITFSMMSPESLLKVMNEGAMQRQAAKLSPDERSAIAHFIGESSGTESVPVLMCDDPATAPVTLNAESWPDWGGGIRNYRHVSAAADTLSADQISRLQLKWAFAYPGATRARSQPLVVGNAVFMGSQDGTVYNLDLETGCARWTYAAGYEVRNGPTVATVAGMADPLLLFGDFKARVHAVNARTGAKVWISDVATHADATITGAVKTHDGRVYVPISSSEWATAADPGYPCCTFRGGVAALDLVSGEKLWTGFVMPDEPAATGELNAEGAPQFGPSGAPVWNSPSIDTERGMLYVGTGEAYTSPASESSDAVIAFRLSDGQVAWRKQLLGGDAWNMACFIGGGANCPEENGPDLDIGASTILWRSGDIERLLVGQKSGDVYALDPDNQGEIVWHRKLGRGGYAGGVHWGMSTDGETLFAAIADTDFIGDSVGDPFPGIHALDPATGELRWYARNENRCEEQGHFACDPGMSAAITTTDTHVIAGGFDGILRIFDSATGEVVWEFNTFDRFTSVNGDIAKGGAIESDGPVLSGGHLLVNSGYQFGGRIPGNALLVFAPAAMAVKGDSASE